MSRLQQCQAETQESTMTKDEFAALPLRTALRLLWDALDLNGTRLVSAVAPKTPFPPKFDQRVRVKGGYVWASECDVRELEWHCQRVRTSENPAYAERNQKEAKALQYWIHG